MTTRLITIASTTIICLIITMVLCAWAYALGLLVLWIAGGVP